MVPQPSQWMAAASTISAIKFSHQVASRHQWHSCTTCCCRRCGVLAAEKKGRRQSMCSCSPQGSTTVLGVCPLHYTPRRFMVCQLFTAHADTLLATLLCVLGVQVTLDCLARGSLAEEHQQRCSQTRDKATKPAVRQQHMPWLKPQLL